MSASTQIALKIILPLIMELLGLASFVIFDPYIHKKHKRYMLSIILLSFLLIVQNLIDRYFGKVPAFRQLIIINSIIGYSVRPMIIVAFMLITADDINYRLEWTLVILNSLIYMTALFSDIAFTFTESMNFHRGPLGYSCHIISFILLALLVIETWKNHHFGRKIELIIPTSFSILVIAATAADTNIEAEVYISFLTIAVINCSVFYYIWLHFQFVWEHEQALQAEKRIQIMISQIQPHFLFNTLSTIQALILVDPGMAFDILEKFGTYLRQNIDSLNQIDLIPFEKELEHTQVYADIEMIRFPSITVSYEIEDDNFLIPALTVQPIVENAIRHGIRGRKDGVVNVSVRRLADGHRIVIRDNGKGFAPKALESLPVNEQHIGIRNVRERVESMCGGSMEISSAPGEGTAVSIWIPA